MKSKTIIFVAFICSTLLSCTSDDNNNTTSNPLNGAWDLSNVYGGLSAIDIDYAEGEVTWTFDTTNEMITVENNIITTGPEQIYSGLESGVYAYEIIVENLEEVLFIEGVRGGILTMDNNAIQIDSGLAFDGTASVYIRR